MLWYADGQWSLQRKDYNGDWDKAKVLWRKKSKCKFFQKSLLSILCLLVGLNITNVSGKWEECEKNQTESKSWQATASIEAKMLPSK